MKVLCCLLLLMVLGALATTQEISKPATYWITFPTRIHARTTQIPISVRLLQPNSSSAVMASLRVGSSNNSITLSSDIRVLSGGDAIQTIVIQVPPGIKLYDEKDSQWSRLHMLVEAAGDVIFSHSVDLTVEKKSFSIFVQTDKAIYKPGQTVKIRTLAMNPDLTVLREPMNVVIRDPKGNVIRQWSKVSGVNNTGVVELIMPTSQQPPLGVWTIEVTVFDYMEKKTFTMDKYVLPKFEVMVSLPNYMLTSDPKLAGTVTAKYTFGKPLTGATVIVTAKLPAYNSYIKIPQHPMLTETGTLDADGKFTFSFSNEDLFQLVFIKNFLNLRSWKGPTTVDKNQFIIIVKVIDPRTGQTKGQDSSVTIYKDPVIIDFLPMSASSYKPGLPYSIYMSVTKPDGTLLTTTTGVQIKVTGFIPPWHKYLVTEERKTLPENGYIVFEVLPPSEIASITIEATCMGAQAFKSVSKSLSPSSNYLQVQMQTKNPQVGQSMTFIARTTEPVKTIAYQIIAKGKILSSAEVNSDDANGSQNINIFFPVTSQMAPSCRIVAFYIRHDGEVVADSMSFKVDSISENSLSLSFNKERVKPGEEVDLSITGKENSIVFLLAVDKSITLLKSGNDITQEMVTKEVAGYDYGIVDDNSWNYMSVLGWPYTSKGSDTTSILKDIGITMLTDGRIPEMTFEEWPFEVEGLQFEVNTPSDKRPPHKRGAVERVRVFFPETWLWDIVFLGTGGHSVQRQTVPDSITTWMASAFAIHSQFGLSVVPEATQLITFRDVFVSLDLPYSVIRGEDVCMKAYAFNYDNQSIDASLTIGESQGLSIIHNTNNGEQRQQMKATHHIGSVATNRIGETTFCFQTTKLGYVPVRVNLTTTSVPGDGVEQLLLVEPEGLPRSQAESVVLDVSPGTQFVHTASVRFPDNVVQDSQRITVSVTGSVLGQLENSEDLLRMPYGCGEQNMVFFAPNVFLINYMQRTNTYTSHGAAKAEKYMLTGYQQELQYQHGDGSYSAFGPGDTNPSGSMWLTAFVTKCFVQSMRLRGNLVTIDPRVVKRSVLWIVSKQLAEGEFPEPGEVFDKTLQGGSTNGEALTAFVLISLVEANSTLENLNTLEVAQLQESIRLSRQYLEYQLILLTDPYDLAIVTYALHLVESDVKDIAFDLLSAKAIRESSTLHWERQTQYVKGRYYLWERQTNSVNIEMTAYALLTYMIRSDLTGALSIVRWMTKQKGPRGGFISTQDTVIGLQSLAEFAAAVYAPNEPPITVFIDWGYGTKAFIIDDSTKHLFQQMEIPLQKNSIPSSITFTATTQRTTSSIAVAEVLLDYNVAEITNFTTYSLQHDVVMPNHDSFVLTIEARRVDRIEGGMTVIEVGIPTGYSLDTDNPAYNVTGSRRIETEKGKCIIYLDALGSKPVRFVLTFEVSNVIPVQLKPSFIYMYDYYDNGGNKQLTSSYELPLLKSNRICDILPRYPDC